MKRILIAVTLAIIFILSLIFMPASAATVQGGYAYGASENVTVRYIIARPFQSLDELNAFLDYYREHKRIVFVADGTPLNQISNNCKEMAKDLQDMATKQGYDFPTETLTQQEMYKIYGKWPERNHRINKAWIPGVGEWYYDFNTDKLWRAW